MTVANITMLVKVYTRRNAGLNSIRPVRVISGPLNVFADCARPSPKAGLTVMCADLGYFSRPAFIRTSTPCGRVNNLSRPKKTWPIKFASSAIVCSGIEDRIAGDREFSPIRSAAKFEASQIMRSSALIQLWVGNRIVAFPPVRA